MVRSTARSVASPGGRPSFAAALQCFLVGASPIIWVLVVLSSLLTLPASTLFDSSGSFWWAGLVVSPLVSIGFNLFEKGTARPLAFMKALPLRHGARWLPLLPACAFVMVLTIFTAAMRRFSLPVTLTVLGCGWWAVSIGHRFAGRSFHWLWLAVPLCWLGSVAAMAAVAAGGWWLAAAVLLAMTLLNLVTTRDHVAELLVGATSRARGNREVAPPLESFRGPSRPRQPSLAQNISQLWLLSTSLSKIVLMFASSLLMGILASARDPVPSMSAFWVMLIPTLAGVISNAQSPAALEFLRTRPFRRGWLVAGTLVPWALIALLPPATALLNIRLGSLNRGLERRFGFGFPPAAEVRYLRDIVGATWLSDSVAFRRLPLDVWIPLRPLLYWHVLRLALLTLATVLALSGYYIAAANRRATGTRDWPRLLLMLVTIAATLPCTQMMMTLWHGHLRAPPLWLCSGLALLGIVSMSGAARPLSRRQMTGKAIRRVGGAS